jgi:undecaprenyl diphosphate synthase
MSPKPYTHKDAVAYRPVDWTGLYPPRLPASAVPDHVALVMDGNGRWANRRGLTRIEGHRAGEASLLDVVAGAIQIGIKHLSVYAFSTENWRRSPDEVRFLMGFNRDVLHRRRDQLNEWGVRVRWAGRRPRLWASVIKELQFAERLTAGNDVLTLTMCVNYGGRTELADAVRDIASEVAAGRMRPSAISEKTIQRHLYVPDLPDVDLLGGAAHQQLHALAERVRRDGLPRHAVARLLAHRPVAGDRDVRRAQPAFRRCRGRADGRLGIASDAEPLHQA